MKNELTFPQFREELARNIRATIADLKRDGTVGMSIANLMQVTRTPRVLPAPIGTNAPYIYRCIFTEVVATVSVRGFNIYKGGA